jgi:hypothetical protein
MLGVKSKKNEFMEVLNAVKSAGCKKLSCVVFFLFIMVCVGCDQQNRRSCYVEEALLLAGDNRAELEKVLTYYKNNPLKLNAALFLIENMPGHYSFEEPNALTHYYDEIDSVYEIYKNYPYGNGLVKIYEDIAEKYDSVQSRVIPDAQYITSDFLIDNIDRAFDVWKNGSWSTHVNFDDFCEYILPYKCEDGQTLDNWRQYSKSIYGEGLEVLNYCALYKNLAFKACEVVNLELKKQLMPQINLNNNTLPIKRVRSAIHKPFGTCDEYGFIATSVLRAEGIPASVDYTPQWPFRSMGHAWNVLLDNFGKKVIFIGCNSQLGLPHKEDHPMVKVFRKSYAINREIEQIHRAEKYVPPAFRSLCIKDVTEEYMQTFNVCVEIKNRVKNDYAYLAVFDNKEWVPVHYGKISGNRVDFKKVGGNAVYLPVCYNKDGIIPISNPLVLTSTGVKQELTPDLEQLQETKLYRKYPLFSNIFYFYKRVIGAKIQASNYSDFRDSITLHIIQPTEIQTGEIDFEGQSPNYRFWRYCSPDGSYCSLAELYFFSENDSEPIYGKVIGTNGSFMGQGKVKELAFDKDPFTYYTAANPNDSWVGMDFGKPESIKKINYIYRGDGNTIVIGNEYELMYWNNDHWNSLGRQIAKTTSLIYKDCPINALFLLHNLTEGIEERIFTYVCGEQVWW